MTLSLFSLGKWDESPCDFVGVFEFLVVFGFGLSGFVCIFRVCLFLFVFFFSFFFCGDPAFSY